MCSLLPKLAWITAVLLIEKEHHTSKKIQLLKRVIFLINIHKKSWNNKHILSMFDKAHFEQETLFF